MRSELGSCWQALAVIVDAGRRLPGGVAKTSKRTHPGLIWPGSHLLKPGFWADSKRHVKKCDRLLWS